MKEPIEPYGLFLKKESNLRLWPWIVWMLFGIFAFPALILQGKQVIVVFLPLWTYGCVYIAIAFSKYNKNDQSRSQGFAVQLSVNDNWFRIHFLTGVVLMIGASILLGIACFILTHEKSLKFDEAPPVLEQLWNNYITFDSRDRFIALAGAAIDVLVPVVFGVEQVSRATDSKTRTPS